jgi:hypothetical protein
MVVDNKVVVINKELYVEWYYKKVQHIVHHVLVSFFYYNKLCLFLFTGPSSARRIKKIIKNYEYSPGTLTRARFCLMKIIKQKYFYRAKIGIWQFYLFSNFFICRAEDGPAHTH